MAVAAACISSDNSSKINTKNTIKMNRGGDLAYLEKPIDRELHECITTTLLN
jgi:hypothetical protein